VYVWLKKPVNDLEVGRIKIGNINKENFEHKNNNAVKDNENYIIMENIFGKEKKITYNTIELISFEHETVVIQKKSETTLFNRLGFKILKKLKPDSVLSLDKV
jgi:hypothetical protein